MYGVFLLWSTKDAVVDEESTTDLKTAVDIIANKIALDREQQLRAIRRQRRLLEDSLSRVVDHRRGLKENLAGMAPLVCEDLPAEIVSIAVISEAHTVRRFSAGRNGSVLSEIGVDIEEHGGHLRQVLRRGEPVILHDTGDQQCRVVEGLPVGGGVKSLISLPLKHGQRTVGAITLGSGIASRYSSRELHLLEGVASMVKGMVVDDIHRTVSSRIEKRRSVLSRFLAECSGVNDADGCFREAARLLHTELQTSMVRISTFDSGGAFLRSRALVRQHGVEVLTPDEGHMVLSLMPYHCLVRDTGRIMLVNQQETDRKIDEAEARQSLIPELEAALLVPIRVGQQVVGVISIADKREWSKYHYRHGDVALVSSMASVLALVLRITSAIMSRPFVAGGQDRLIGMDYGNGVDMPSKIRSSLSGIIGSVEMIKAHPRSSEEVLGRCLSIIDRSARKIGECLYDRTVNEGIGQ